MRRKLEWKWEKIDEKTQRIQVIGGWVLAMGDKKPYHYLFLEDKEHQWVIIPAMEEQVSASKPSIAEDF